MSMRRPRMPRPTNTRRQRFSLWNVHSGNQNLDNTRSDLIDEIAAVQINRHVLERRHGRVWSSLECWKEFRMVHFCDDAQPEPYVVVIRKSDYATGILKYTRSPRFYYGWEEEKR